MPETLQSKFDATLEQTGADSFGVAATVLQSITDAQEDATQALSDAAAAQATADGKVSLAGQLGGSAASPDVRGIRETSGPTLLTIGDIPDGGFAQRVGSALVGLSEADLRALISPQPPLLIGTQYGSGTFSMVSARAQVIYLGHLPPGTQLNYVHLRQSAIASGAGQAEVAILSSPGAPIAGAGVSSQQRTVLAATAFADLTLAASGARVNPVSLGCTLATWTHVWVGIRCEYASSQPTFLGNANRNETHQIAAFRSSTADLTTLVGTPLSSWSEYGGLAGPMMTVTAN